jgi:hypothetical protein
MSLKQLVYLSRAVRPMTPRDLDSLRVTAARNNPQRRVTGALLYVGGNFLQLLEGDAIEVDSLFAKIQKDSRHTDCRVLALAPAERRLFPDWSMNVIDVQGWSLDERKLFIELILDAETPGRLPVDRVFAFFKSLNVAAETVRM